MSALLIILAVFLVSLPGQDASPAKSPQDKRGLGIQPTATPSEVQTGSDQPNIKPELVLQSGHSKALMALAFSPDGRLLASGGLDSRVIVWEIESGRQVRVLAEPSQIGGLAFSRDGRWLASSSEGITIWDHRTGEAVRRLKEASPPTLLFSPSGGSLAGYVSQSSVPSALWLWDTKTGKLLTKSESTFLRQTVAFSPDSKWLSMPSGELIEAATGDVVQDEYPSRYLLVMDSLIYTGTRENRTLTLQGKRLEHPAQVEDWSLSADGRWLAVLCADESVVLWEVSSGRKVMTFALQQPRARSVSFTTDNQSLVTSGEALVKVWQIPSGRELHRYELRPSDRNTLKGETRFIKLTPDGRWLVRGLVHDTNERAVEFWDRETLQKVVPALSNKPESELGSSAYSPDGRWVASREGNRETSANKISLRNLETREHRILGGGVIPVHHAILSKDGRWLGEASESIEGDKTIRVWDVSSGNVSLLLKPPGPYGAERLVFSPDGRRVASEAIGGSYAGIFVWDPLGGKQLHFFKGSPVFDISPDGKWLAQNQGQSYRVWDLATGALQVEHKWDDKFSSDGLAFNPDGKTLGAIIRDGRTSSSVISIREITTGREVRRLGEVQEKVSEIDDYPLAFSPDGQWVAAAFHYKTIIWNMSTGTETASLAGWIKVMEFSPNGRWLITVEHSKSEAVIWESATGRKALALTEHTSFVNSASFSADGKWLLTASDDGTARLWEAATGREVALLALMEDSGDWLVVTPEGLFDGSLTSMQKLVGWRFQGNETLPLEAFFNEFYYPGLLADIVAGKRPRAARNILQIDRRQPQVRLSVAGGQPLPTGTISTRNQAVRIEITEAPSGATHTSGSGARDVRLFRNGSLVKVWRGDVLKGKNSVSLEATVPLVAGDNRLTAYAFNRDNIKSSDATLVVKGAESLRRKGVAYVLAVGVNEYANAEYNLNYAVADAEAFAEETKRQQAKLNQYERVEIIPLNDKAATKANILKSLTDLAGKTQPEDGVFIFFAGHGTAQGNRFYLIPHDLGHHGSRRQLDAAGLQTILAHSISDEELERAVEGIDAGQLLMVIDACNSGQALEAEEKRRGPMNSKGLAQLAYEKGMYILTAAQSYQAALEAAKLGHGYLTYALVEEGLKTSASDRTPKDGQVLVREWLDFATARVPEMQMEKIEEQRKMGHELGLVIKFVESDTGSDRNVQRPRVFYRREAESSPLVVVKP